MNRVLAISSLLVLLLLSAMVFFVARPQAAPAALHPLLAWLDASGAGSSSGDRDRARAGASGTVIVGSDAMTAGSMSAPVELAGGRDHVVSVTVDSDGRQRIDNPVGADPINGSAAHRDGRSDQALTQLPQSPGSRAEGAATSVRSGMATRAQGGDPSRPAASAASGSSASTADADPVAAAAGASRPVRVVGTELAMLLPPDAPRPPAPTSPAARAQQASIRNFLAREVIEFEVGRDVLTPVGRRTLDQVAALIAANRDTRIVVQGHTDGVGDDVSNLELSTARALRARDYLIAQGIDARRLKAQGFGERVPLADNDTGEGRKRNRRIDFTVIDP